MILSSTPCDPGKLDLLLGGELSPHESAKLEEHLSYCSRCQKNLERLAGNRDWWESTEVSLRAQRSKHASSLHQQPVLEPRSEKRSLQDGAQQKGSLPRDTQANLNEDSSSHGWLSSVTHNGMLGPFRIEKTIGFGGTGVVAQAFDTQLNRRVAVKVLYPHLAANGAARQRFAREAQAAAAVVHPSVVPIHAVNAEHSPPYLVMSYVPGGSLQQRLEREGPLELVEVLRIAMQISDGLAIAHLQGLVHRDVKPANILLEAGTDRVLLTDFGLARALDDATLTASGFVAGTPPYMSPEQARGDNVDGRSDIFSVGSLLFAMATGRTPFVGSSALHILQQVNEKKTPLVRSCNERMPEWLDRLIAMCHTKSPDQRIQSSADLTILLQQCLAHVQQPNVFPLPASLQSSNKTQVAWISSSLLVGCTIGVALGWFAWPLGKKLSQTSGSSGAGQSVYSPSSSVPPATRMPVSEQEISNQVLRLKSQIEQVQCQLSEDWK